MTAFVIRIPAAHRIENEHHADPYQIHDREAIAIVRRPILGIRETSFRQIGRETVANEVAQDS
jgi:hypothetical protein